MMARGRWGWSPHSKGSRTLIDVETDRDRLREVNAGLLDIAERLVHLDARLRLRSPATATEIRVWAELRDDARRAITEAKGVAG